MQDKNTKEEKKDSSKLVGENTYGLGVMAKYSWTFVLSVTAALSVVAMTLFQPGKQSWRNREDFIGKLRMPADRLKEKFDEFSDAHNHRLEGIIPVVGASFLLASFLKRVLEVPAFVKGRREARKANEKYAAVVSENAQLEQKLVQYEGSSLPSEQTQAGSANRLSQEPVTADKDIADETSSPRFSMENKPSENHVAAVQDRKSTSPLIGNGV